MLEIIPTIIAKDFQEVEEKIKKLESHVDWVQLDIMDGKFVDNTTWNNPQDLSSLKTRLNLEAHLMIENPEDYIDDWINVGVGRIIFHYESTNKHKEIIEKLAKAKIEVAIAINPETSIDALSSLLPISVLIMTVHPGRGGQEFIEDMIKKIKILREKYKNVNIGVDGGINLKTAPKAIKAGANILNVGSVIWKSENIEETINKLKSCH